MLKLFQKHCSDFIDFMQEDHDQGGHFTGLQEERLGRCYRVLQLLTELNNNKSASIETAARNFINYNRDIIIVKGRLYD